jgi:uncharacterized protein YvpB
MKKIFKIILIIFIIGSFSLNIFLLIIINFSFSTEKNNFVANYPTNDNYFKSFPKDLNISELSKTSILENRFVIFSAYKDLDAKNSSIWIKDNKHQVYYKIIQSYNYSIYSTPIISPDQSKLAFAQIYPFSIYVVDLTNFNTELIYSETFESSSIAPSIGYEYLLDIKWLSDTEISFEDNSGLDEIIRKINIYSKEVSIHNTVSYDTTRKNVMLDVPHLSQRDQSWQNEKLGTCDKHTIKSAGCAIASIAMITSYLGNKMKVSELNKVLTANQEQGYFNGCDVKWYVPTQIFQGLKLKWVYFNEFNLDRVHKELNKGNPIIVGFNRVPFTQVQHWVVITGYVDGKYYINDPWDASANSKTLDDFGGKFDHMVVYEKKGE